MSTTVDQRVVEMRFDNKQFESNVSQTMSTLDKLKQSLNLKGASQGLESVNAAANKCDMTGLGNAVETVKAKFSALQVIGVTALANITNSAINAGTNIVKALTLDPIMSGFQEYETQINAVQTILANTASKGTNLEQVNQALDTLNLYADKTIYNFTEMTRNIGTFTAAGIDLETSVSAIQGIANLAAVSGSTSQQASTAMYQLSQALAAGTVKLQDWNSVVNAGMGGQVFQDALKDTARAHGVAVDEMIEKNGSFRESLQEGWITSDILTETLKKMTRSGVAEYLSDLTGIEQSQIEAAQELVASNKDGSASYDELAEKLASTGNITKEEALELLKMADTAEDAATKVKTFTQLWDTLKEAAQSGWTQTWEILIGDFEEAKELLTNISDVVSEFINKTSEARNNLLQGWKDLGGRTDLIEGLKNIFESLISIVKAVSEAFKEVFPAVTAEQLHSITEGFRNFTEKLKLSDSALENLKNTFKGIFSVIHLVGQVIGTVFKIIVSLIGALTGGTASLGGGLLAVTGNIGEFLSKIDKAISDSKVFENVVNGLQTVLSKVSDSFKRFADSVAGSNIFNGLKNMFEGLKTLLSGIASTIGDLISSITSKLGSSEFGGLLNIFNTASFGAIAVAVTKFVKMIKEPLESLSSLGGITDILDGVKGCLESYQDSLKADVLQKIAIAIGILAAALFVISLIDGDKLSGSLAAITVVFTDLIAATALFSKIDLAGLSGVTKSISIMIGISAAVLILAAALKKLDDIDDPVKSATLLLGITTMIVAAAKIMDSEDAAITKFAGQMVVMSAAIGALALVAKLLGSMSWEELAKGGVGLLGIITMLVASAKIMDSEDAAISKFAGQMIVMSIAIGTLALVAKLLGSMSWDELARAGTGIIGIITIFVLAAKKMEVSSDSIMKFSGQMLVMSVAIGALALVAKLLGSMSWEELARAGVGLVGIVSMLIAAVKIMDSEDAAITKFAGQMLIMSVGIGIMAGALKMIASLSWEQLTIGLIGIAGAMATLVVGLNLMEGTLAGSAALLVASAAILVLATSLKILGSMSIEQILVSLIGLAGAFAIMGAACYLLGPLIPVLLSLSAAIALFGVGCLAVGVGVAAFATGLALLAASGAGAAIAIKTILVTIIEIIPAAATALAKGIIEFAKTITEGADTLAQAAITCLLSVLDALVAAMPQFVEGCVQLILGLLEALTARLPELINYLVDFVIALVQGISSRIGDIIAVGVELLSSILKGIIDSVSAIVEGIIAPILQVIKDLLVGIFEAIAPYIPVICESIERVTEIICNAAVRITEILAPFIPNIQSIVDAVSSAISSICEAFISLVEQIAPVITSITELVQQLGDSISQIFTSISEVIMSVGESIKAVLDGIANVISSIGEAALNAGTGFEHLANGVRTITELNLVDMGVSMAAVATALAGIASKAPGLAEAGNSMQQIANSTNISSAAFAYMSNNILTVLNNLSNIGSTAAASMATMTSSVISASSCFDSLSSAVSNAVSNTVTSLLSIGNAAGSFASTASSLMSSFCASLTAGSSTALSIITDMTSQMVSYISSQMGSFQEGGAQLANAFADGINANAGNAKSATEDMVDGCKDAGDGIYDEFVTIGGYAADGFAVGISNKAASAATAAAEMVANAIRAAKDAEESNSPAKKFIELAKFAVLGYAKGFSDNSKLASDESESMVLSAIDGAKALASKFGEAVSSDLDVQPTISPVVDMSSINDSNIQLGANINAVLSKPIDSMSQLMSNAQAEINESNQRVVDAVNGLREDLASLYSADDKELALYMDSRKVASTLVKPMNQQLNIALKRGGGL